MKNALNNKTKAAFTLFELIIVVLLISIVYGVFVHKLSTPQKQDNKITLQNIALHLDSLKFEKEAKIICTTNPMECKIYLDKEAQEGSFELFADKPIVYILDKFGKPKIVNFPKIFDQNGKPFDTCFEFKVRKNGSNSSFIIDKNGEFYVFKALQKTPQIFKTLDGAKEFLDVEKLIPVLTSDYQY